MFRTFNKYTYNFKQSLIISTARRIPSFDLVQYTAYFTFYRIVFALILTHVNASPFQMKQIFMPQLTKKRTNIHKESFYFHLLAVNTSSLSSKVNKI